MMPAFFLAAPLRACASCPACRRTTTVRAALYHWLQCTGCGERFMVAWAGRGEG